MSVFLAVTPAEAASCRGYRVPLVHIAYAVGDGGRLLRSELPRGAQGGLLGLSGLSNDMRSLEQARKLLAELGLEKRLNHLPAQLSGGEQQRVALARAFIGRPAILFADEPTGNLDRQTGDRIADLLFSLNRETGATLVLVTHDPQLAARCDRRLRLQNGLVREEQ